LGKKYLNALMRSRTRDPESFDPGSKIQDPGWKNLDPGSETATLVFLSFFFLTVSDPGH